jgi:hypothetical protein
MSALGKPRLGPSALSEHSTQYSTDSLHFSCWLICQNLLPYVSCARVNRKVWFFFEDQDNIGARLNAEWQSSNPMVAQKTLLEVLRMLRREMTEAAGEVRS